MCLKMSLKPYSFEQNVGDIDGVEHNYFISPMFTWLMGRTQVEDFAFPKRLVYQIGSRKYIRF